MVEHALRLVVAKTRREFIYPATHYASSIPATSINYPAMGQRMRLKSSFVIPSNWTIEEKAVLRALQKYGAIVADNGNFFSVSVCPDDRFSDSAFSHLSTVAIDNFEVIQTTGPNEGPRSPNAPTVNAGADRFLTGPGSTTLSGVVSDPSHRAIIKWKRYSGPANVTFANGAQPNTSATFNSPGAYTLMLSADDGVHSVAYDAVVISVGTQSPTPTPSVSPSPTPTPTPGPSPAPVPLGNVSTRAQVGIGDNVLIGGFVINGTGNKKILVRALGPSLSRYGVAGVLSDPVLELHNSRGDLIFANDNWKDTQEQWIRGSSLAPSNDRESAIVANLWPGPYTAIVRGKNNTAGVALVEVYDLQLSFASRLTNISARGFVGTGDHVIIAGLSIPGPQTARVLFRGVGPSLSNHGVTQPLQDPRLDLFNVQGARIATNNNWRDSQQAVIMATGMAPANNLEAAIRANLLPGNYTAIMSGPGGETGIGLIEAFSFP